jgi:hypothetical protein
MHNADGDVRRWSLLSHPYFDLPVHHPGMGLADEVTQGLAKGDKVMRLTPRWVSSGGAGGVNTAKIRGLEMSDRQAILSFPAIALQSHCPKPCNFADRTAPVFQEEQGVDRL